MPYDEIYYQRLEEEKKNSESNSSSNGIVWQVFTNWICTFV